MKQKNIQLVLGINTIILIYIELRQFLAIAVGIPESAKRFTKVEEYSKSVSYNRTKLVYSIITGIISLVKDIFTIKLLSLFYKEYLSTYSNSNTLMIVLFFLFNIFTDLPFSFFFDFVIEEKYGFNKKTVVTFFRDAILNIFLTVSISYPVSSMAIAIIYKYKHFYIHLWVFFSIVQFGFVILYPTVIAPLYNKFKPLEDGPLRTKINELAARVNFKATQILVMDGSKRSGHSNAYFTGFGKAKKIVFYDTILNQLSQDEILAVLCHEFGHWACYHTYFLMAMSFSISFFLLYFMDRMISSGGADLPISIKIIEFSFFSNSMMLPINLISNFIVRCFERQADMFAVNLGYGKDLSSGLIKLSQENKSTLVNDPVYSTLNFSHPPVLERLELIEKAMASKTKKNE